jgi:hypothetical protein
MEAVTPSSPLNISVISPFSPSSSVAPVKRIVLAEPVGSAPMGMSSKASPLSGDRFGRSSKRRFRSSDDGPAGGGGLASGRSPWSGSPGVAVTHFSVAYDTFLRRPVHLR